MDITGGNSIYEQARDGGGIVDMMVKDMRDTDKSLNKGNKKKGLGKSSRLAKRRELINRIQRDSAALKKMGPM